MYCTTECLEPLVISYCNSDINNTNPNTNNFIRTLEKNDWNYTILGRGDKWINFVENKIKSYLRYLKNLNPKQIVVISDARDVFCVRNKHNFIKDFYKYNKKLLVSMELFAEGIMNYEPSKTYFQVTFIENYWKLNNIEHNKIIRKFVNSGLITGYVENLINCFQWIIDNNYTDDQKGLGGYINTFPELCYADINADILHTSCAFVNGGCVDKNIQNQDSITFLELTGIKSYFIHIPGLNGSKGQQIAYDEINKNLNTLNQVKIIELYSHYNKETFL
jgi:hypothetical protein